MTRDDVRNDPVLAMLGDLPSRDVDDIRGHRLRRRCRAALTADRQRPLAARGLTSVSWQRILAPAMVAMWGALYVIETLRQAVAIYRP